MGLSSSARSRGRFAKIDTMSDLPRVTLGDLAHRALATRDAAERQALVAQLARGTRTAEQSTAVADLFLGGGPRGNLLFLEWVGRVRTPLPDTVLDAVVPLLAERKIPSVTRVLAAAKVLRGRPDRLAVVRPVVRALTRRMSLDRGLDRLRQLEHQLEKSRALDVLIARRERRVKMDCPRCGVRLPRVEMVKHLWHEHALTLEKGKIRGVERAVGELKAAHAAGGEVAPLDRGFLLAGPVARRAWVASSEPTADETAALRAAAQERGAGLCPGCFTELAAPSPPLPPPLALADGRLAGDGYEVRVGGSEWVRTVTASTPSGRAKAGGERVLGPRGAGTVAALPLVLGAFFAALFAPPDVVSPFHLSGALLLAACAAYAWVRYRRDPPAKPDDAAVDAAWSSVARKLVGRVGAARFLTRLCRASLGRGDHIERVAVLNGILEHSAEKAADSPEVRQLLAAARVLRVEDGGRAGRDRVAGIGSLAAVAFKGELPTDYADAVVGCFLDRDPPPDSGERARLRVLLIAAAFDAGLKPRTLIDLWGVAPNLRRAMAVEPLFRLGLLAGVWQTRNARPWEPAGKTGVKSAARSRGVAAADSVFELCKTAPNVSGRVLADFPDLLLFHRPDAAIEAEVGPVLVCARGVSVGGVVVADPDAAIEVVKGGRFGGAFELVFGPHRVKLTRRLPDEFLDTLREWLRFRADVLLPFIDGYLEPASGELTRRVLGPYSRKCGSCGTVSAVAVGKIGTRV